MVHSRMQPFGMNLLLSEPLELSSKAKLRAISFTIVNGDHTIRSS